MKATKAVYANTKSNGMHIMLIIFSSILSPLKYCLLGNIVDYIGIIVKRYCIKDLCLVQLVYD